jgi:general secretion pathway protein G
MLRANSGRLRATVAAGLLAAACSVGLACERAGEAVQAKVEDSRQAVAQTQLEQLGTALDLYRMDNGKYPTTEQGLEALVREPSVEPLPRSYPPGGYLLRPELLADPWGRPFTYQISSDAERYVLASLGSDGAPGGEGTAADLIQGN